MPRPARLALAIQVMDPSSDLIAGKDLSGAIVAANHAFRAVASLGDRGVQRAGSRGWQWSAPQRMS